MLDGTVETDGCLVGTNKKTDLSTEYMGETKFVNYRTAQHYDDFDILKGIFEEGEDGKLMLVFKKVTPDMSIATGIGCLANKIEYYNGIISEGVMAYRSAGDKEYLESINQHLENMECDPIK